MWTVDGVTLGRASASSVVHRDGSRSRGTSFIGWTFDDAHPAAYDPVERLRVMDEVGVWAQIVYPNAAGFGGQRFGSITDPVLKNLCATLYNDAMVELQEQGQGRLFPMALLPWWDVEASVAEAERAAAHGAARRQHDQRPAAGRRTRPRRPRPGIRCGRSAPAPGCR